MSANRLNFELPPALEATEPPEARGLTRDSVRLLVSRRSTGELIDSSFNRIAEFLESGDLVVVNTSATIPAALDALSDDGAAVVVHLSTHVDADIWVVEPRRPAGTSTERWRGEPPPARLTLHGGVSLELLEPYRISDRLWIARVGIPTPVHEWLAEHARPISYKYVQGSWPIEYYQNVYSVEPGSAEMASAGRPFTNELLTRLAAKGVGVAPIVLHTGVSSPEALETPYAERVRVPKVTAAKVNQTHRRGGRVIAIGTTVVRALESAANPVGHLKALDGWTELVITPERGVSAVDGVLTGWHEPAASHLLMLEAIAGRELLEASYFRALSTGYRWHEFGDAHLILP